MSEEVYRHELKFVCEERHLQLMENKIKLVCKKDCHVDSEGIYRIRSMYFDTYDNRYLFESLSGVNHRYKYRIRIYNESSEMIKLERKSSVNGLKRKETCNITKKQCEGLLHNLPVGEVAPEQALLADFLAERAYAMLRPSVIVEYTRTPYVYFAGNVRVTFDRNILASDSMDFFGRDIRMRCVMPMNVHILEVKYDALLPSVMVELLNSVHDMRRESFSKYVLCKLI